MRKRGNELGRAGIPQLGSFVRACCEDPSTVRAKFGLPDQTLMSEGGDEFARSCIPEFGSFVPACRQDSSAVRTKRRPLDQVLMLKGGDERRQCLFTMNDELVEESF